MCTQVEDYCFSNWADWVKSGRPGKWIDQKRSPIDSFFEGRTESQNTSMPLIRGTLRSYWLKDVDRCIACMPERQQYILLGMYMGGRKSEAQRARELGIPVEICRACIKKAKDRLKKVLH
jgi:DNA-directed RNA polymerase specialized sigma24 family protein